MHITISRSAINHLTTILYYLKASLNRPVDKLHVGLTGEEIREILGPSGTGRRSAQVKQALIQGALE